MEIEESRFYFTTDEYYRSVCYLVPLGILIIIIFCFCSIIFFTTVKEWLPSHVYIGVRLWLAVG